MKRRNLSYLYFSIIDQSIKNIYKFSLSYIHFKIVLISIPLSYCETYLHFVVYVCTFGLFFFLPFVAGLLTGLTTVSGAGLTQVSNNCRHLRSCICSASFDTWWLDICCGIEYHFFFSVYTLRLWVESPVALKVGVSWVFTSSVDRSNIVRLIGLTCFDIGKDALTTIGEL